MADREIKYRITADSGQAEGAFARLSSGLVQLNKDSQGVVANLKQHWIGISAAIAGAAVAASQAWDLMARAAKFEEQMYALDKLARKYGDTSTSIVADIRAITKGMVSLSEAADIAASGVTKGLRPEQIRALASAAEIMSNSVGEVNENLRSFVEGLSATRQRAIVTTQGTIDLKEKYGELAEGMSETEKQMAFYIIILERAKLAQDAMGESVESLDDKMTKLKVTADDAKLYLGEALSKVMYGVGAAATAAAAGLSLIVAGIAAIGQARSWIKLDRDMIEKFGELKDAAKETAQELFGMAKGLTQLMLQPPTMVGAGSAAADLDAQIDKYGKLLKAQMEARKAGEEASKARARAMKEEDDALEQLQRNYMAAEERERRDTEQMYRDKEQLRNEELARMRAAIDESIKFETIMTEAFGTETEQRLLEIERWEQAALESNARRLADWAEKEEAMTRIMQEGINRRDALLHQQQWQGPLMPAQGAMQGPGFWQTMMSGVSDLFGNIMSGLTSAFAPQSFLSKILGGAFTGGNVGGMAGSFAGGALGNALWAPLTSGIFEALGGGALGNIFGAISGSLIPGLGTVLGGVLGSFVGRLFGKDEEDWPRMRFRYRPGEETPFKLQENNFEFAQEQAWNRIFVDFRDNLLRFSENVGLATDKFWQDYTGKWQENIDESDIQAWFGKMAEWWTGIDFAQWQKANEEIVDTVNRIISAVQAVPDFNRSIDALITSISGNEVEAFNAQLEAAIRNYAEVRDAMKEATDPSDALQFATAAKDAVSELFVFIEQTVRALNDGIKAAEIAGVNWLLSMSQRLDDLRGTFDTSLYARDLYGPWMSRYNAASSPAEQLTYLNEGISMLDAWYASRRAEIESRYEAEVELGATMENAAREWSGLLDRVRNTIIDLRSSPASPQNALERLAYVESEVSRLIGRYTGASPVEKAQIAGDVQGLLQTYISVAQEAFQRPSPEYQAAFNKALSIMNMIEGEASYYSSIDVQSAIADNTSAMAQELAALNAEAAAYYEWAMNQGVAAYGQQISQMREHLQSIIGNQTVEEYLGNLQLAAVTELAGIREVLNAIARAAVPGYVPAFAAGGYVDKPTLAIVGESGPEWIIPENRMKTSGMNVTININATGDASPREIAREVRRELTQIMRYGVGNAMIREAVTRG